MSDPTPLTTRLLALRAALGGVDPSGTLATVEAATKALLAQGDEEPTTVAGLLAGLRGETPATLATLRSELEAVKANTAELEAKLVLLGDYTYNTFLATEKVLSVTGDEQTDLDNQWTTRGGLWQIYQLLAVLMREVRSITRGVLVDEPVATDTPSLGSEIADGYRWAKWGAVPEGVSVDTTGLVLSATDWAGISMLVQTTDPAPFNGVETVSAGSWWPLSGSGNRFARVLTQYPIAAYLRDERVTPTEPVIAWQGTNQNAYSSGIPALEGLLFYFLEAVPSWAQRVQLRTVSTSGFGNFRLMDADYNIVASSAGGTNNITFTLQPGWKYIGMDGGGSVVLSGTVWFLAEGVNEVP